MSSIKDLQDELLFTPDPSSIFRSLPGDQEAYILVFKNYKFHKKLSIELYKAATTTSGKIKNPLKLVHPLDAALHETNTEVLQFFASVSRFQNNPSAQRTATDIEALKIINKNPLAMRFFVHDPGFSGNVSAGSLREVSFGTTITDVAIEVQQQQEFFTITASLTLDGTQQSLNSYEIIFEQFILNKEVIHLLGNMQVQKAARFFRQHPAGLKIPVSRFREFKEQVLDKLEDRLTISYRYIQAATTQDMLTGKQPIERLIYLSDHEQHVAINPVMKYGDIEIPVLSKRQVYVKGIHGDLVAFSRNDDAEIQFIALLIRQHPDFEEQLDNDLTYFYLSKQRFLQEDWFLEVFEQWQDAGIQVLGFNQLKNNKYNPNKAKINIHVTSGLNWFNTDINVRYGKKKASLKQLHQSVRNKSKYVQLDDGTMGILPTEWLEKFEKYFNAAEIEGEALLTPRINYPSIKELYEAQQLDPSVQEEINNYEEKLSDFKQITDVTVPAELNATLRHYQKEGLNWLNFLDDFNFGGCLADDMGLGKTLQVIAFILVQRSKVSHNTNLIVVPTSLIFNWQAEIEKFAPSIKIITLYGSTRIKHTRDLDNYEIVLTSYGTLLSDINFLKEYHFNYIFLDESQNIKNVSSQRYETVRKLRSRNKIVITGTPIENNSMDLYAQLSFACPGLLGSRQSFRDLFSIPIDKFQSSRNVRTLQQKVAPFILRRTKKDVASELPEKTEMVIYCPMDEAQRKVYDAYEREFRDFVSGKSEEELNKSSMHVLKGLTRLRQICNSPLLLEDEKLFSDRSSKIETLIEQIENNAPGHKILVFSQFVSMLELIRKELDERNIGYEFLSGATKDREAVVNNFQTNEAVRVFLVSLKAGGTGLNLTEADYVYIVDPWWNPAVENQAIDRSYRIGQKKNVVAIRLICPGTLEEKIMKMQETKKNLSVNLVKTGKDFYISLVKIEG